MGGGRSRTLSLMATNLLDWCAKRHVSLTDSRAGEADCSGRLALDERVDNPYRVDPSKGHCVPDTGISFLGSPSHRSVCHEAEQSTSDFHFSLPRPVSMAVDATSQSWEGMIAYAFPLIPLLMKVLLKIEKETCLVIMAASCWESHPFFPVLLSDGCTSSQTSNSEGSFDPASIPYSSSEAGNLQFTNLSAWYAAGRPREGKLF